MKNIFLIVLFVFALPSTEGFSDRGVIPDHWCGGLSEKIQNILNGVDLPLEPNPRLSAVQRWRNYMNREITQLIDGLLMEDELDVFPLTYSVLALAERFGERSALSPFPSSDQGDESSNLTVRAVLEAALEISVRFDEDHYVVAFRDCRSRRSRRCRLIDQYRYPGFTAQYLRASVSVLFRMFESAAGRSRRRFSVVDAMGEDLWELRAHVDFFRFVEEMVSRSPVRRFAACVSERASMERARLLRYLRAPGGAAQNERVVGRSRVILAEIAHDLERFIEVNGRCR